MTRLHFGTLDISHQLATTLTAFKRAWQVRVTQKWQKFQLVGGYVWLVADPIFCFSI